MKRICLAAACLVQLSFLPIQAQDFGFLRISYGDRAYFDDQLPTLFNPDLIHGEYRLKSVYTESLYNNATRIHGWGWDMLHWSSPTKMTVGFYWILIDPLSYPPEKIYQFNENGQVLYYSGKDYIVNQVFNHKGQLVLASYQNLRSTADFAFTQNVIDYLDNGQINKEIKKYCQDTVYKIPLRRDSNQYIYNGSNQVTEVRTFVQSMNDADVLWELDTFLYSKEGRLLEEQRLQHPELGIFQRKHRIQYDFNGQVTEENQEELSEGIWQTTSRKEYSWSADGLRMTAIGKTLMDHVWNDTYYYHEVKNQSGQPLIIEEFYTDKNGNFYNTETGWEPYLTKRTYGELKGRNTWTYDERGLVSSFSHYSFKMQPDALPDFRKEFNWQLVSSVPESNRVEPEIKVCPNPCNDQLFIEFKEIKSDPVSVIIYDISGRQIKSLYNQQNSGTLEIPVADLSPGLYFLCLNAGGHILSTRFIRN